MLYQKGFLCEDCDGNLLYMCVYICVFTISVNTTIRSRATWNIVWTMKVTENLTVVPDIDLIVHAPKKSK